MAHRAGVLIGLGASVDRFFVRVRRPLLAVAFCRRSSWPLIVCLDEGFEGWGQSICNVVKSSCVTVGPLLHRGI